MRLGVPFTCMSLSLYPVFMEVRKTRNGEMELISEGDDMGIAGEKP